jgi:hypothetical protein
MTKQERKEFTKAWYEAENIITLIEPEFIPEKQFKRPEEAGPYELNLLLQFLRVAIKMELHDKESTHRENETLRNLVDQHTPH